MSSRLLLTASVLLICGLSSCIAPAPAFYPSKDPNAVQLSITRAPLLRLMNKDNTVTVNVFGVDGLEVRADINPILEPLKLDPGQHELTLQLVDSTVGENYLGLSKFKFTFKSGHTYKIHGVWNSFGATATVKLYDTTNGGKVEVGSTAITAKRQLVIYQ